MPKLDDLTSATLVKTLYIGESGSGKTGSLASLAEAGYKLHIIDTDNGLPILYNIMKDKAPTKINNVDFMQIAEEYIATSAGLMVKGTPKAASQVVNACKKWEDGTNPSEWGPKHILVLDSLTTISSMFLEWGRALTTVKDGRMGFYAAQERLEVLLTLLSQKAFNTNVIIIGHAELASDEQNKMRYQIAAIGKALGPKIPRLFNTLLVANVTPSKKREIITMPGNVQTVMPKNPAPVQVKPSYSLETGLAQIFADLTKGNRS